MNFAMRKTKLSTFIAETVKNNFKGTIGKFVASDNAFSLMSWVQGAPEYCSLFLCDVLAMVKQLGIPAYFLALSLADLRWEELPHFINKLNNVRLSDEQLKKLRQQQRCNLLNSNPGLVAGHFQ